MTFVLLTFIAMFVLIGSGGLLLFYRQTMLQRISAVTTLESTPNTLSRTLSQTRRSVGNVVGSFERLVPKSLAEVSVTQQRLIRAGYRSDKAVNRFYSAKVGVPLFLCLIVAATGIAASSAFFVYACALGLGFLAPDFWLGNRIKKRQDRIRLGLPDALDLLVICIEAGQSLDQATVRTGEELKQTHAAISDELGLVVLEQRAGRPRSDAWRHFAERTAVDSVRNMVAVLIQSEQFGTSIAKTLRVHAESMRTQRKQRVEEMAAKTTVKLVFPLVLFIFPSLFLVTLGPAVIIMADSFSKLNPQQ